MLVSLHGRSGNTYWCLRKGGCDYKPGTVKPYPGRDGVLWRALFVPLYRRIPWTVKRRAMDTLKMTANGWTPPERRPSEPWRPPSSDSQGSPPPNL